MSIKLLEDFCEDELVDVYMRTSLLHIWKNGLPIPDEDWDILLKAGAIDFLEGRCHVFIISRGDAPSEGDMTIEPDGSTYDPWAKERAEAKAQGFYGFVKPDYHPNCRCGPIDVSVELDTANNMTMDHINDALRMMWSNKL